MINLASRYTGGCHGYGNMESYCTLCGQVLYEEVCDENGIPTGEVLGLRDGETTEEAFHAHFNECPALEEDDDQE